MMMLIIFLITDISMVGILPESMEILQNTGKEC